jgi:hypothetical protein
MVDGVGDGISALLCEIEISRVGLRDRSVGFDQISDTSGWLTLEF